MDGDFLGNVSNQGRGSNEYLGVNDAWINGYNLFLLDTNGKRVLICDLRTKAITNVALSPDAQNPFEHLIPLKNGGYVGEMIFQGSMETPPELAFYDNDFVFLSRIGDMQRNSGQSL